MSASFISNKDRITLAHFPLQVKEDDLQLVLVRGHVSVDAISEQAANGPGPVCRFVNIELIGATSDQGSQATVLLENPRGKYIISLKELLNQVRESFS